MAWLIWRQHRSQALVTFGLLAALGIFLLVHGVQTADIAAQLRTDQAALDQVLADRYSTVGNALGWLPLAPALIGLFWGAPVLGKEFERGTHRLVWTQSVSLRRWLAAKLTVLSVVVVLAGLAFGAMVGAWLRAFDGTRYANKFGAINMFTLTGLVPAAWWLFAFVTGVAAGAVLRRTLPAIAATLAVVLTAIISMFALDVRVYYATPERMVVDSVPPGKDAISSDWYIQRSELVDADGQVIPSDEGFRCPSSVDGPCQMPPDVRQVLYYHPPTRYWRFQWTETALLLTATLALGVLAVHRTARSRI